MQTLGEGAGGCQTKCIMGDLRMENSRHLALSTCPTKFPGENELLRVLRFALT